MFSLTENNSRPRPGSAGERSPLRRVGARRSLAHRAHEAVPRHRREEDRRPDTPPGRCLRAAVREGADPASVSCPRHGGATDPCPRIQGIL